MKRINSTGILSGLLTGSLLVIGCTGDDVTTPQDTEGTGTDDGDDDDGMTMTMPMTMTGADSSSDGTDPDSTSDDTTPMTDDATDDGDSSSSDDGFMPVPVDMFMEITNISGDAVISTPISPGVWLNHEAGAELLFPEDMPDPGEGLEALAEDGDPTALLAAIADNAGHLLSGAFTDPVGGAGPAPIFPGETYRVEFTAEPDSRLSAAMMLVGSNDQIIATGDPGVGLFAGGGQVQGVRDVTNTFKVWDAGTEVNQANAQGPWQAQFGGSPNMGAPESGGVFQHNDSTRAMPLPIDLILVEVEQGDGMKVPADTYTITITNTSNERGTLPTPFSGMFWMTHDDTVTMFEAGAAASAGIEAIAEDGGTNTLAAAYPAGGGGVGVAGEIAGPILPGDSVMFEVATTTDTPWLTFATMVVESNDAFLAPPQASIRLYDAEDDSPRDNSEIEDDIMHYLTVWDAGTEANETPGAGPNQVLRQAAPDTGPADADATVRIYQDEGSDLEGAALGGMLTVSIVNDTDNPGEFTVRLENTSATTGYNAVFTPAFHMLHDDSVMMFEVGTDASPGLESLAEDGDTAGIIGEWDGMGGVLLAAANADPIESDGTPVGAPGPIAPGQYYEFNVTPDATNRFFSFAQMVVPSNDTFAAFGSGGIALLNAAGDPRTDEAISADIAAELEAWDAGTEANQAGAAGRDQAPRQAAPNTGLGNGSGLVRRHRDAAGNVVVWSAPEAEQMVQIIVGPVRK